MIKKPSKSTALGRHLLLELYDCDKSLLNNVDSIKKILITTAKNVNAKVINSSFHHFSPYGVSGVIIISESHFTIHTWPEYGYAAIDVFTCSKHINYDKIQELLIKNLSAKRHHANIHQRGTAVNPVTFP